MSGLKWLVNVSTHSSTPGPTEVPMTSRRAPNQCVNVCRANRGSGRRPSMPPSRLTSRPTSGNASSPFASRGIRAANPAQRGNSPSE